MDHSKLKRFWPRTASEVEAPAPRRSRRLGSDPMSRRVRLTDRWDEGFLRLPSGRGLRDLSYIVDGLGIYYDATAPSELEIMLEEGGFETAETLSRARSCIARLREERLSLDNDPRRRSLPDLIGGTAARRVIVVDQPRGDPTIGFGLAGASSFPAMLAAAAAEEPEAECVVVMDPAAAPGARGHIDAATAARYGARLVTEPVTAWSVAEAATRLLTVTSHVGLEATLAGRAVTCFGLPFYAGWGFTTDRLHLPRRSRRRTPEEVFAAAYLVCSRYFDPYAGEACLLEEAIDILSLVVGRERENQARTLCLGFSNWKRRSVSETFASPGNRPTIPPKPEPVRPADLRGFERVIAWSSRMPEGTETACRAAGVPLLRMEDGFLRSVGLGVALRPGASHVLDATGVYYDATRPSDLEHLLETAAFDEAMLARAAELREAIVAARVSKYNVGGAPLPPRPRPGPLVLVAGQVENDASIRLGTIDIATNAALLRRARERHPGAVIAFKPHPDVEAGLRPGWVPPQDLAAHADMVLRDVSAADAIDAADHVETLTSLIGFEALLRGKPVTTHGLPFYAGWGLTESPPCPRRTRRLSLDELVAGALIAYPRYVDPRTGLPCPPEVLVRRLAEGDPSLSRRELTAEAVMKQVWSLIWRRVLKRG
ncbi:capsular polysaccharide biosynthesis protein [Methylobacterium sp. JK268]